MFVETWNIWTHLLGTVLFFILMVLTLNNFLDRPSALDCLIFVIFLLCAQCQMLFSTLFHTFACTTPTIYKWLAKLDYIGISLMIVGSYYPPLYYMLECHSEVRITYLVLISLLGVVAVIVSLFDTFATPRFRIFRAGTMDNELCVVCMSVLIKDLFDIYTGFFLVFGFFAVFPIPHMILLEGFTFIWPVLW
jgi:adiponectin receptor